MHVRFGGGSEETCRCCSERQRALLLPNKTFCEKFVLGAALVLLFASLSFAQGVPAPSVYSAYTGTDTKPIPPAPALGPANSTINDPAFGSRILRVTDQNTLGGQSFISTDSGFSRTFNADSTAIKLTGPRGEGYWLEFNPSTFKVGDGSSRPVPHQLPFGATWQWSAVDPNIVYFLSGNQIAKYNKSTGAATNLGGPPTGEPVGYAAVVIGFDNWVCATAGSGYQDTFTKIFCINPTSPSVSKLIDVYNRTVNGVLQGDPNWPLSVLGGVIGIHDISGGTGPSGIEVFFHQIANGTGSTVFNLATNTWSLLTNGDFYWAGHFALGNGKYANSAGSVDGRDSRGMLVRNPDNMMNATDYLFVGQPPDTLNNWCDADHSSWFNSLSNPNAPILISRYNINFPCNFAWTGEIIAAAVDGSDKVWRFAHNHNGGPCYYADAFAQISNDGKWALFSSTWDGMLGTDASFGCSTRIDTFMVELLPGDGGTTTGGGGTTTGGGGTTTGGGGTTTTTTTTRIEQTDPSVTYTGNWSANGLTAHSGGSAVLASEAGAKATFTFTGTGVSLIGYRDEWSGIAQVYLDNVLAAAIDTYASPSAAQAVLYTANGLASGSHTLVVSVTGTKNSSSGGAWVWVDAFDVASATTTTTTGGGTTTETGTTTTTTARVEETSSSIAYTGSWSASGLSLASGGSAVLSMTAGSRATFAFTGTGVNWIGYRDEWSGIANVYVDGVFKATVDTYASPSQAQTVLYSVSGLASGSHTFAVEAVGTRSSLSGGAWVWVDAFDVISTSSTTTTTTSGGSTAPAAPALFEETSSAVTYARTWSSASASIFSGGSAVLSMENNAQAAFAFTGTGVSWIGYSDQWSGIAQVFVDGNMLATVDTYSPSDKPQAVQYALTGLSSGSHKLVIKVTGRQNKSSGGAWVWVDAFKVTP